MPEPLVFGLGGVAETHQTTDWWAYDGTLRAPLATALRAPLATALRAPVATAPGGYRAPLATALRGACSCGSGVPLPAALSMGGSGRRRPCWYDTSGP
ncbi:hypothetical protein ABZ434_30855 [Streptomyces sp. NPDC005761]|uniref:hypothetical protein n=1 Tax=Streptomyces sp. NPDC005761 TaxID=3157066 RepID=UPI0033C48C0F